MGYVVKFRCPMGFIQIPFRWLGEPTHTLTFFMDPVYPVVRYWHRNTLDSWQNTFNDPFWRWYSVVLWPHTPTRPPFAHHGEIWGWWDHATRVVEYTGIYHNIRSLWIYITIPVLYIPFIRQDRVFIESNILVLSNIGWYCTYGSVITEPGPQNDY